jgi:DNA primase
MVPRVILVFDADSAGTKAVDRALEILISHNIQLSIATLPEGLDPCDMLLQQGAISFQAALTNAVDVLEFKLNQVLQQEAKSGVEGTRRAIDSVLGVIARGAELTDQGSQVKRELMVTRIAQRFGVKEETIWARLRELRDSPQRKNPETATESTEPRMAPAAKHEIELLQVLLADPGLVNEVSADLPAAQIQHPGIRQLLEGLYRLQAEGVQPTLNQLRSRIDNIRLMSKALEWQEIGLANPDRRAWFKEIIACFREKQEMARKQELQTKLVSANDHATAVELLRQLQNRTSG